MTKRPNHSRLPRYCFVVFASIFAAIPAEAHLNSTGMGPIYDGLMHFLMSPEDLLRCLHRPCSRDFAEPVTDAVPSRRFSFCCLADCWLPMLCYRCE